jgi:hypothetical protein
MTTVNFNGLTFSSDTTATYKLMTLDGWYSAPPVRPILTDRPNADGSFNTGKVYRNNRVITLTGWLVSTSTTEAIQTMWRNFAGTMSDGQPFILSVTDDVNTLYSTVVLNSPPEVKPVRGTAAQVTVQFVAVDPIKYDAPVSTTVGLTTTNGGGLKFPLFTGGVLDFTSTASPSYISATNSGTAPVYPNFTITGPASQGFNIVYSQTGATIGCSYSLATGDFVSINQRTGRLVLNGNTDITNYLVSSQFFAIPPLTTATIYVQGRGGNATGNITITMSNGYW